MQRRAFKLRIREGTAEEYVRRHQAVHEDLLRVFESVGIKTYSIFMDGNILYAYMEAEDLDSAIKSIEEHPANIRWQKYMSDILIADHEGRTMVPLPEVFHFPQGAYGP
ncbi:L-rhamnose mutarotase [Alicyclobacillus shizuokensis]|uniref:L-rhamnose mutarotase n=1 Tax=Alicyclobacillus shizuokensis TaxID=392014 RepID=UPI00082A73D3|nr:L-rhamnose mutarotase [Alicyclobacillus shizuokensis]MCL6625497.1 L-rhamnose mutarotase [Alicyclobacillus shizuokensis]